MVVIDVVAPCIPDSELFWEYVKISEHWDGAGSWNCASWMARTGLFYTVTTIAPDDMVIQGARASAVMELT